MPLLWDSLAAHGFAPWILEAWKREYGPGPLPLQEKAIRETGFLQGRDLVVFAPTASGKTFLGEMAAIRRFEEGKATVFLAPSRSLAEEKAREFSRRYRALGIRVLCSTRERPENDPPAAAGHFDWLVAVYEKFASFLVSRPELLGRIGLLVADELQMLGDRERGALLDVILTKARRSPYRVQRLGLSASLPGAAQIAHWLDAGLLIFNERPVDLLEGIVDVNTGLVHWKSFNTGQQGLTPWRGFFPEPGGAANPAAAGARAYSASPDTSGSGLPACEDEWRREAILAIAHHVAGALGEQTLVFVPTRGMSRSWAWEAAQSFSLPPAEEAIEALKLHEACRGRELLEGCFRAGVAFHNSGLPAALRRLVEDQFRKGGLRVLFSTPTLAQGVNLTGRNVLQVARMISEDPWTGQAAVSILTRERFCNQGGRAARTGIENLPGRSLAAASGLAEVDRARRLLLESSPEPIAPPLESADLAAFLLDLLVSRAARTRLELLEYLLDTYTGRSLWGAERGKVLARIDQALIRLERAGLIQRANSGKAAWEDENGPIESGGLAQAAASASISPETAGRLARWLRAAADGQAKAADGGEVSSGGGRKASAQEAQPPPIEALLAAALCGEMLTVFPPLLGRERFDASHLNELRHRLERNRSPGAAYLWNELARPSGFTMDDRRAVKLTLMLDDWIGPGETPLIEEQYGVLSGSIGAAGAQAAWLIRTAGAMAAALGQSAAPEALRILADRLEPGVSLAGLSWARLRTDGLGRGAIAALLREGIDSPADLEGFPLERLEAILPPELLPALFEAARIEPPPKRRPESNPGQDFQTSPGRNSIHDPEPHAVREPEPNTVHESGLSANCDPKLDSNSNSSGHDQPQNAPPIASAQSGCPSVAEAPPMPDAPPASVEAPEPESSPQEPEEAMLIIHSESPGIVDCRGQRLRLTPLPFRLLMALARKPGQGLTYREITSMIWLGEAQVQQQQIHGHRRSIMESLAPALGKSAARSLIRTLHGQGLLLNLAPGQVRIQ